MKISILALASLALLGSVRAQTNSTTTTSTAIGLISPSTTTPGSVNPIVVDGTVLVDSVTNQRFFAHGVGYDYAVTDSEETNWKPSLEQLLKDAPLANVIRIYIMDEKASHDKFMQWALSKGLYVIIPLTPAQGPVLDEHGVPPLGPGTCYPSALLTYGQKIINQFSTYPNVLAYMVGNEVLRDEARWKAAPCVKGYARDLKQYMSSCPSMRVVPLMYADSDDATPQDGADQNNRRKADYLTCGPPENRIDIYGINTFRWCNSECTYESCRWKDLHDAMSGVGIPVMLTEHGCDNFRYDPLGANIQGQRSWSEMRTLLSDPMAQTFSGGIAYTFGVRGGVDFSFYDDGSVNELAFPGITKTCGYCGVGKQCCNIDNYQSVIAEMLAKQLPTKATADSANRTASNPVCQSYLDYDMSMPITRQGADGYVAVTCPPSGQNHLPTFPGSAPVLDNTPPKKTNLGAFTGDSTFQSGSTGTNSTTDSDVSATAGNLNSISGSNSNSVSGIDSTNTASGSNSASGLSDISISGDDLDSTSTAGVAVLVINNSTSGATTTTTTNSTNSTTGSFVAPQIGGNNHSSSSFTATASIFSIAVAAVIAQFIF